ncbi:T9SS type A sorting domain-containing protein [Flavobacterium sp. RNTU_13]|uniref:T9SS type A sorting domain-containing protein n=1 Tax=Flavobacterium sp. RNTU_13 TaxID=3375145 RepID=UPI0039860BAD
MKYIFTLLVFAVLAFPAFAQTEHIVAPNTADPLSGAPNNYHFVYTNPNAARKNKLFLFFLGTGGVPAGYRQILKLAANLGYHAIGLTYPNDIAINDLCAGTTDITCHGRARQEVFDGIDRHPDINVDQNNCIQRRTQKLLQYLATQFPNENWAQYMNGDNIQWNKIVVSGHSQGGGHAGIISKLYEVDRVVMFAATDWVTALARTAEWITWNGATPTNRYYGFVHQDDEMVNFTVEQITWANYGMAAFGALTLADNTFPPYGNSRMLYTQATPANDPTKFHGCIVADPYIPMNGTTPVFTDVWTYLIDSDSSLSLKDRMLEKVSVYPNPFSGSFSIADALEGYTVAVYDILGREVDFTQNGNSIQLGSNATGMYLVKIQAQGQCIIKKLLQE